MPGQVFYDASRKLILKGVDGVVFVADSPDRAHGGQHRVARQPADQPEGAGLRPEAIPYVIQYNKRDLPNVATVDEMAQLLRRKGEPVVEAVASKGTGVFETLKAVAKLVLQELKKTG